MTEEPPPRPSQKRMQANVNRGLAWTGVASSLVGLYDILALLIILNTWISPDEYGIATLAVWIYPILDQATDLGLSAAVIQRDDHDPDKISTVFWINLTLATLLFIALAAIAPIVGSAYGHAVIGYMMIAYGTKLVWQNVYFIPAARTTASAIIAAEAITGVGGKARRRAAPPARPTFSRGGDRRRAMR